MFRKVFLCCFMIVISTMILAQVTGTAVAPDKYGNVGTNIPGITMTEAGFEIGDMLQVAMPGSVIVVPFVTTYGDVDRGNPLVRISGGNVLLAVNYGNFSKTYGLEEGAELVITLFEKGSYKEELEIRHLVRTNERGDYPSDAVFANFREVAIGNIGAGKLYRSSHPSIDDPRAPFSSSLVEAVGVTTVINLSDSDEELTANYAYSEYYRSLGEKGNIINLNMGVDMLSDEFAQKLRAGLHFMIEKDPPYLVHCVEGKDRAGMVSAMLEAIMDAPAEEIFEDYVKSYENYYHVETGTLAYEAVEKIIVDIFKSLNDNNPVDNTNIKSVAMNYLTDKVGLSAEEIAALQAKLR